jgi:hypothetical protein
MIYRHDTLALARVAAVASAADVFASFSRLSFLVFSSSFDTLEILIFIWPAVFQPSYFHFHDVFTSLSLFH